MWGWIPNGILAAWPSRVKIRCALARGGLAFRRHGILQVDDDGVCAARHRLVELAAAVGGGEEQ
jgi:hypothetical protein